MLKLLTDYLLHFKQVTLPQVGTLRLVQHPAQLRVADKQIDPPFFSIEIGEEAELSNHQLSFFSDALQQNIETAAASLRLFGNEVSQHISTSGFAWEGVGTISSKTQTLPLKVDALTPVAAEKIIRQDANHTVLQGDDYLTSTQIAHNKAAVTPDRRRSGFIIAGWILLVLSILAIAFFLYQGKFKVGAAGSKSPVTLSALPVRSQLKQ